MLGNPLMPTPNQPPIIRRPPRIPPRMSRLVEAQRRPPGLYLDPRDLRRLSNFQFAVKLVVEGYFHGRHRSPYNDFSSEFADYRPYTPGDEIRAIDWRAFARTDRFYIKLSRKETDLNCTIVLDKSSSMAFRGAGSDLTKLQYASYMAGALSYLLIRQGDKAGLALCDDRLQAYIPAGGTHLTLQRTLVALERATPGGPTRLSASLESLFGLLKRKGLLVVISDFLDDTDAIFSTLGMFVHRGFSVLLLHTLSSDEMNLPGAPNALFVDMESPSSVSVEPDAIRKAYQEEMVAFVRDMDNRAKARRIHYHLASTSEPYTKALEAFLTARTRH